MMTAPVIIFPASFAFSGSPFIVYVCRYSSYSCNTIFFNREMNCSAADCVTSNAVYKSNPASRKSEQVHNSQKEGALFLLYVIMWVVSGKKKNTTKGNYISKYKMYERKRKFGTLFFLFLSFLPSRYCVSISLEGTSKAPITRPQQVRVCVLVFCYDMMAEPSKKKKKSKSKKKCEGLLEYVHTRMVIGPCPLLHKHKAYSYCIQ